MTTTLVEQGTGCVAPGFQAWHHVHSPEGVHKKGAALSVRLVAIVRRDVLFVQLLFSERLSD